MGTSPKHLAIIPDGNRRWAKKRGLLFSFGHRQGAKTTEKILKYALNLEIPSVTFWGCSLNNIIKRSKIEVNFLFNLFDEYFKKLAKDEDIYQKEVKINVFGQWEKLFPQKVQRSIKEAIEKTKNHKKYQLTFLLAYSGSDEMVEAIKKITKSKKLEISEKLIKNNLWTKDLPAVDLIIRTGEKSNWSHNSDGFMMWEAANAQLYFTDIFWPDFSEKELKEVIDKYQKTERRLGS